MRSRKTWKGKAAAVMTTVALGLVGVAGVATVASAAPQDEAPWTSGAPTSGSLTLEKREAPAAGDPALSGDVMSGITFKIQRVGLASEGSCEPIDLGTLEGWEQWESFQDRWGDSAWADTGVLQGDYCAVESQSGTTGSDGRVVFSGLDLSPYLVTETNTNGTVVAQHQQPFLTTVPQIEGTQWEYNPIAYPKNVVAIRDVPIKTVSPTNTPGASGQPWLPDAVTPWVITASIPASTVPYNFVEVEEMSNPNLVVNTGTVTLDGTQLVRDADYTLSEDLGVVTLTSAGLAKVNQITLTDSRVASLVIAVNTTLNDQVDVFGTFENSAALTLNAAAPLPVLIKPVTKWGLLNIHKTDENTGQGLEGATFRVWPSPGGLDSCGDAPAATTGYIELTTDSAGDASQLLWVSNESTADNKTYCLQETVAPQGYLLDETVRAYTLPAASRTAGISNVQPTAPTLPLTGGTGTLILSIAGAVVIGGATVAVVRRSAKSA